jgi:hypothetical protein
MLRGSDLTRARDHDLGVGMEEEKNRARHPTVAAEALERTRHALPAHQGAREIGEEPQAVRGRARRALR